MEFFKSDANINFMKKKNSAFVFSIFISIISILCVLVFKLNLGLDFTGGTQIELHFKESVNFDEIRSTLEENNLNRATVQAYGEATNALIKLNPDKSLTTAMLKEKIAQLYPKATIERVEYIGPQVGETLVVNGIIAVIVAILVTMVYIALRFDYLFAISAAVSLIHDPVIILGTFALLQLEFDLIALAAILTILGYSINDTIVVYDRIRENFKKYKKMNTEQIVNAAINQTLSRTIMTSGLTLLVVVALALFGGETLRGFSIALIVGIIVGTYSSIYIAGSLAVTMGLSRESLMPKRRRLLEDNTP